jgi:hypothetical protein
LSPWVNSPRINSPSPSPSTSAMLLVSDVVCNAVFA